ncbi:DUF6095 family protein [Salinimicrobium gaetbulicola]|uniref:DUF6095 family protein n=1 Tax=Salinimicrobium gaetbulicola TaxID=999702 RepID=A0ABW3IAM0_9FLAO
MKNFVMHFIKKYEQECKENDLGSLSIFGNNQISMKHTNKSLLMKGLKYLAGALPLSFLGPVVLFSSFKNQEHAWFIPILIFALVAMAAAIFLMFKGIRTVMKALFD